MMSKKQDACTRGEQRVGVTPGPIKWSVMPHGQQLSGLKDARKD